LGKDGVNRRGDKKLFQPTIGVHTHDHEIHAALVDLLCNDLSRGAKHDETLERRSCGRIGHDVFETLVQQRIGAIEVVRQSCPSAKGGYA